MLTIFSIPKAFKGHTGVIQRNAVQSWKRLCPGCEVILCADDAGTAEVASEFQVGFIPDIERNQFGTPLVSSAFRRVSEIAKNDVLCFVNADILLLSDLAAAVRRIEFDDYLLAGQRWDVDITEPWDFDAQDWQQRLRDCALERGKLHIPAGSDYFVFPKGSSVGELPAFAVGRPGWDCWLIYHARKLKIPMVDLSRSVMVIHQNHDYGHVPKTSGHTTDGREWVGPEADLNHQMVFDHGHFFDLVDATHVLAPDAIRRARDAAHLRRRWYRMPALHPRLKPLFALFDKLTPRFAKRFVLWLTPSY